MTLILILGIIIAIILTLVVLVQNPKGGGLASNFSQGNQIFGVEKTTDIVEKVTWAGAIMLVVVSLIAASFSGTKVTPGKGQGAKPAATAPAEDVKIPTKPKP